MLHCINNSRVIFLRHNYSTRVTTWVELGLDGDHRTDSQAWLSNAPAPSRNPGKEALGRGITH